jgi:hypothetical protein
VLHCLLVVYCFSRTALLPPVCKKPPLPPAIRVVLGWFFFLTARSLLATRERSPVFFAGSKSEAKNLVLRVARKILALPTSRQIELSNFFSLSYFPRPHRHHPRSLMPWEGN